MSGSGPVEPVKRVEGSGVEVFVLKREVIHKWSDRKKKIIEPVFRSYLFARVNEAERISVLQTPGVVKTVNFGSRLAEVTEQEMEQLKLAQLDPRKLALYEFRLPPKGSRVVVTQGPMKGLTGVVVEHRSETYLVIRVEAIRQALKVNIPAEWTTPVPNDQAA